MALVLSYDVANTSSWPGSGTTLYDLSGQNNHGTLQNGPVLGTGYGGYIGFDGINDEITTTNQITNPQTFSLGVWFRIPSGFTQGKKLIGFEASQTGQGSNAWDRHIWIGSNGKLYFGVFNGSTYVISSSSTYNDNVWHYVVATYTANSMKLYVDGALIISANSPSAAENYNGYWRIGGFKLGWTNGTEGYYYGLISKVLIWNEVLDATQISTDYSSLFSTRFDGTSYPPAFYQNLAGVGVETLLAQQTVDQQILNLVSEGIYQGTVDQQLQTLQSEAMYKGSPDQIFHNINAEGIYIGNNLQQQIQNLSVEVLYVLPPNRKKTIITSKAYNYN